MTNLDPTSGSSAAGKLLTGSNTQCVHLAVSDCRQSEGCAGALLTVATHVDLSRVGLCVLADVWTSHIACAAALAAAAALYYRPWQGVLCSKKGHAFM
jgi:hypothetical protein